MTDYQAVRLLKKNKVRQILEKPRRLSGGDLTNKFYEVPNVYKNENDFKFLAKKMYELAEKTFDVVASCGGGMPLAEKIGEQYGLKVSQLEKHDEKIYVRRPIHGHIPSVGERVYVVDDVYTKGGTLKKMWLDLAPSGCVVVAFGIVLNRSGEDVQNLFGIPVLHLVRSEELDAAY